MKEKGEYNDNRHTSEWNVREKIKQLWLYIEYFQTNNFKISENLKMMVSAVVAFVFPLLTNSFIEINEDLKRTKIFATFIVE